VIELQDLQMHLRVDLEAEPQSQRSPTLITNLQVLSVSVELVLPLAEVLSKQEQLKSPSEEEKHHLQTNQAAVLS
jgi:hypothetical protein